MNTGSGKIRVSDRSSVARFALMIAITVLACVAGCAHEVQVGAPRSVPQLMVSQEPNGGAISKPGPRRHEILLISQICAVHTNNIRVSRVEPVKPYGGLEVLDFMIVHNDFGLSGQAAGPLRGPKSNNHFVGDRHVTQRCGETPSLDAIVVEFYKPRAVSAGTHHGFTIYYEKPTHHETSVHLPFRVRICQEKIEAASCDALPPV